MEPLRRNSPVAALAAVLAGAACDGGPAKNAQPSTTPARIERGAYVFTTDEGAQALSRISVTSGEVRRYPLPVRPHNVQASSDGTRVVVAGPVAGVSAEHGGHQAAAGRGLLLLMDAGPMDVANALTVDIGPHPAHVVLSADSRYAFVTDSADNQVQVVDLGKRRVIGNVPTGRYPHCLRQSPDARALAVANLEDDSVSIIDPTARREVERISVGDAPVQVAWSADGRGMFASLRDDDALAVVDAASWRKVTAVGVGDGPISPAIPSP